MKNAPLIKLSILSLFSILALSGLMSAQQNSGGPASNGSGDQTGNSPFASTNCGTVCHGGGSYGTTLDFVLKDDQGNTVNTYLANQVYTLEFTASGSSPFFGMQAVSLLDSDNSAAGQYYTVNSQNTQISYFSGRPYIEHDGRATSNAGSYTFSVGWIAPEFGSGAVDIYAIAIGANGNSSTTGDDVSTPQTFTIQEDALSSTTTPQGSGLSFYPNPTNANTTLQLSNVVEDAKVSVYSISGKMIEEISFKNSSKLPVTLTGEPGMYILKVAINGKFLDTYQVLKTGE